MNCAMVTELVEAVIVESERRMDDLAGKDMQIARELQEDKAQSAVALQDWMACMCGCVMWCAQVVRQATEEDDTLERQREEP